MRHSACAALGALVVTSVASSQVEWNELALRDGVFREYAAEYGNDVIDIPLGAYGELHVANGPALSRHWVDVAPVAVNEKVGATMFV